MAKVRGKAEAWEWAKASATVKVEGKLKDKAAVRAKVEGKAAEARVDVKIAGQIETGLIPW
jgi:hypothetical protein